MVDDGQLKQLKSDRSRLETTLAEAGATIKGDRVLCPFHDDKEPSLIVTPDKNLWHCLGSCNEGGSAIDWIMKTKECRSVMRWRSFATAALQR